MYMVPTICPNWHDPQPEHVRDVNAARIPAQCPTAFLIPDMIVARRTKLHGSQCNADLRSLSRRSVSLEGLWMLDAVLASCLHFQSPEDKQMDERMLTMTEDTPSSSIPFGSSQRPRRSRA